MHFCFKYLKISKIPILKMGKPLKTLGHIIPQLWKCLWIIRHLLAHIHSHALTLIASQSWGCDNVLHYLAFFIKILTCANTYWKKVKIPLLTFLLIEKMSTLIQKLREKIFNDSRIGGKYLYNLVERKKI
jgi:hypothetical protein